MAKANLYGYEGALTDVVPDLELLYEEPLIYDPTDAHDNMIAHRIHIPEWYLWKAGKDMTAWNTTAPKAQHFLMRMTKIMQYSQRVRGGVMTTGIDTRGCAVFRLRPEACFLFVHHEVPIPHDLYELGFSVDDIVPQVIGLAQKVNVLLDRRTKETKAIKEYVGIFTNQPIVMAYAALNHIMVDGISAEGKFSAPNCDRNVYPYGLQKK